MRNLSKICFINYCKKFVTDGQRNATSKVYFCGKRERQEMMVSSGPVPFFLTGFHFFYFASVEKNMTMTSLWNESPEKTAITIHRWDSQCPLSDHQGQSHKKYWCSSFILNCWLILQAYLSNKHFFSFGQQHRILQMKDFVLCMCTLSTKGRILIMRANVYLK